ncbi:MAG: T9SS type A sorting domain-containing protein [Saprospiraceae bacterium]|nr:T9SS type A sorting domain-containing protein [Saprospiraceae bacterium]
MMKPVYLFSLFILCCFHANASNEPTLKFNFPQYKLTYESTCTLPPPSTLNIDAVGSDWVDVSWPSVPGADQYRLQAFDAITGDGLGFPLFVPGTSNSATVSTVGNSGTIFIRIWSVCDNGEFNWLSFYQSENVDTIILDIVTSGFSNFPGSFEKAVVGFGYAQGQPINWNTEETNFIAEYVLGPGDTVSRRFSVHVDVNEPGLISPDVVYFHTGDNPNEEGNQGQRIVILPGEKNGAGQLISVIIGFRTDTTTPDENAKRVGSLGAGHPYNSPLIPGKLFKTTQHVSSRFILSKAIPVPLFNSKPSVFGNQLAVRPNPFHEMISVQLPETDDPDGISLQLFDLYGKRMANYIVPAGQAEIGLSATQLPPGIYYLRVETAGKSETIKIIKAQ